MPSGFQVLPTFEIPIPFERAFRRPYADFTTSNLTTQYWNAISHQAPAIIYDFYLWLTGRKLRACACQTSPSQLKGQPATSATSANCHFLLAGFVLHPVKSQGGTRA
nr:putative inactive fatty acyl-CoA reductase 2-like protein isoform X4 [Chlorocebus sabaeus]